MQHVCDALVEDRMWLIISSRFTWRKKKSVCLATLDENIHVLNLKNERMKTARFLLSVMVFFIVQFFKFYCKP